MNEEKDVYLEHYGTPRHSGRYPWGSGKKYQRSRNFMSQYEQLRKQGLSKAEIAKGLGLKNTTELNARRAMAEEEKRIANAEFAQKLFDKGMSKTAIAERLHTSEGTVRNLLKGQWNKASKEKSIVNVAKTIGEQVRDKGYLDIGKSNNLYLGITESKLTNALQVLQDQGYKIVYPRIQQLGTNHKTTMKILIPPGKSKSDAYNEVQKSPDIVRSLNEIHFNENGHGTADMLHDPISVDMKRVMPRYAEQGGKDKDGVIELRPGVKDLDLGNSHYAQVRIMTNDGKSYLKGMAIYASDSDKWPKGVDIMFNTNKAEGTPLEKVYKTPKDIKDPHNPYGATISRQNDWYDEDGQKHFGALNIVREEGEWDTWSRNLASQFLSKQPVPLAKRQLTIAAEQKEAEFEQYDSITNPTLKKELLLGFADDCDTASVCLKGAALPRQATKVILPLPDISDKECYAPGYEDGEEVVLIRYPHGGRFEIPRLIVNNRNKQGKAVISNESRDAIGINPKTAEQLSGADFDGDTVVVIPTKNQNIKTEKMLKDLQGFDPKEKYARPEGTKPAWKKGSIQEHLQMGMISNLITDMTIQDAPLSEIARADRHSMTIIDTGKHNLDWKASKEDNGIAALIEKYQKKKDGGKPGGASTLISKAKSQDTITLRDPYRFEIDKETGEKKYLPAKDSERYYIKDQKFFTKSNYSKYRELVNERKKAETKEERDRISKEMSEIPGAAERAQAYKDLGDALSRIREAKTESEKNRLRKEITTLPGVMERMGKSTKLAEAKDAFELSTGTPIETVYAEYSNRMKALANAARRKAVATGDIEYQPSAAKIYATEVASLRKQLEDVKKKQPLERAAQRIANANLQLKMQNNPDMEEDDIKKVKNQLLKEARNATGASHHQVTINDKEWEAIQAGAVPKSVAKEIFTATDHDELIKRALPRDDGKLSATMIARAKRMIKGDYTLAEVANALGISEAKLKNNIY